MSGAPPEKPVPGAPLPLPTDAPSPLLAYHLEELAIARDAADPRRVQPPVRADHERILDVGCGAGQTLIASELAANVTAVGVDVDEEALRLGRRLPGAPHLVRSSGEALPFASRSFDLVVCRVALPYMHVRRAVGEMARVLRPGGDVWLVLHPYGQPLRELSSALRAGHLKSALFRAYVLANGLSLHLFQRQFDFPGGSRPRESFQTRRGMERALRDAGFTDVRVDREPFFVASAKRR